MKNVVKIVSILLIAILCLGYTTVVKATAGEDLMSYLKQTFKVAGEEVKISNEYLKEAQRFIDTYGVTDEQVSIIKAKFEAGIAIMNKAGVFEPAKLSKAQRQELLKLAQEAGAAVNATITYVDGTIIVTTSDGKTFGSYAIVSETGNGTAHAFARTGNDYTIYAVCGVAIIAIAGAVVYGKKKANA